MQGMLISRREFNRLSLMSGMALFRFQEDAPRNGIPVSIVKTRNRGMGIRKAVDLLEPLRLRGREVYLKCNYNSPDPFPATTHSDALRAAVEVLKSSGCGKITLVERSGMGVTQEIAVRLRVVETARDLGINFLPLEQLPPDRWKKPDLKGSHWNNVPEVPDFILEKGCVVQVCNLKTHRFGGQFSASLKNSIGLVAKYASKDPSLNYMAELHSSKEQCSMIAEVNQCYAPELLIMDAMQVFIKGGPESGQTADPGLIAASRDRVALDAVGVAVLRLFGAGAPLDKGSCFDQEQIRRAVELGLGARSAAEIRLISDDEESRLFASRIEGILSDSPVPEKLPPD